MKIKYKFADGTTSEVEVTDEIGAYINESRKDEHAQNERQRYHCYSYDACSYEGSEYGVCDDYSFDDDCEEQRKRLKTAFSKLTETQKRRLKKYASGKTLQEIATSEGVSFQSVAESIESARKKFLRNF